MTTHERTSRAGHPHPGPAGHPHPGPAGHPHPGAEELQSALERGERDADPREVADADSRLASLLEQVADTALAPEAESIRRPSASAALAGVAMRTGRPVAVRGRVVEVAVRGVDGPVAAELAPGVSVELVVLAVTNGDSVVLECGSDEPPLVVGVLTTRIPDLLTLKARKVHVEAGEELLLRSGRGAMRIRADGDVELVGSRIAAMSRGLFRLVGRVLRLN